MRTVIYLVLFLFFLCACEQSPYPGFSQTKSGLYYKIHEIGDGARHPQKGDYLKLDALVKNLNDSVLLRLNSLYLKMTDIKKGNMLEALTMLVEGDSATYIFQQIPAPFFISWQESSIKESNPGEIKADIRLIKIFSPEEYKEELKYLQWKADMEMNEQIRLSQYLEAEGIGNEQLLDGIYYIEMKEGTGRKATNGEVVFIQYVGYFIDSVQFDSTYEMDSPFDFKLGDPGQVIKGMEAGIKQMKEGGKAKLIIPSQLGFGEKGSSTGIIPPFTTLIYEIELLKMAKNNTGK